MSPGGSVTAVHTAPYRIRAPIVRDVPAGQCGTENGVVVYAALIMAQENLPRPYHRKERPFWKSASADRRGRGTLLRQSRKATPGGAAQAARRSGNEMSQTSKQRRRPAKACRAGLPLKGAVCGSRLGLKKRACAASAGVRGYARHKDSAEWLD